jgi:RibD C-terminal domain
MGSSPTGTTRLRPTSAPSSPRRTRSSWAGAATRSRPSSGRQRIEPFATFINGVAKYVATSTPLDRKWANTTVVHGELVEFVRDLRNKPGADIGVHASISVAQALLAAGVVDELRLVIAPTIAGSGRRLLDGLPAMRSPEPLIEPLRGLPTPTSSRSGWSEVSFSSGGGRESNPPGNSRPHTGFEDRGAHQVP